MAGDYSNYSSHKVKLIAICTYDVYDCCYDIWYMLSEQFV